VIDGEGETLGESGSTENKEALPVDNAKRDRYEATHDPVES